MFAQARTDMLKGFEYKQADRQTNISMQRNLKGKLCTFISLLSPRCLDVFFALKWSSDGGLTAYVNFKRQSWS